MPWRARSALRPRWPRLPSAERYHAAGDPAGGTRRSPAIANHRIPLGNLLYTMDRCATPVVHVRPGDQVVVETEDAFSGQIRADGDRRDRVRQPFSNPVNGR